MRHKGDRARLGTGNALGRWQTRFLFLGLAYSLFPLAADAEMVKGVYGVPNIRTVDPSSYVTLMDKAGVKGVFVPPEKETITWFKEKGFQVYVSVNAFGGKDAWRKYPDSRPVKADGALLGSEQGYKDSGGVCPSHPQWRRERLGYIEKIIIDLGGKDGIDGIWLDFIRYPGQWEEIEPRVPDACYCPRCLKAFQEARGIRMPEGMGAADAASWIRKHYPHEWMRWKKRQIGSFVAEVRRILDQCPGPIRPLLGLFLVPWTKGERGNAMSYLLGQDPFELSGVADVISPMVYHRMCGRPPEWVGDMTQYYRETAKCQVWPILQAEECGSAEFGEAARSAARGGAEGVLVYSFKGMASGHWERLGALEGVPDLLGMKGNREGADYPLTDEAMVSVWASDEWGSEWGVPLMGCEPGNEYVFTGKLWRDGWQNGVYPAVSLWGREVVVDTHLKAREWQPVRVNTVCPDRVSDPHFRFINRNRNTTFTLKEPSVRQRYRPHPGDGPRPGAGFFEKDFFPIGVYGADLDNLGQIKRLAVNTVILGGSGEELRKKVEGCHEVGLRYVLSVPPDPDLLPPYLDEISAYARPRDMAFYVNDEPEIWSFPVNRAEDVHRLVKARFPGCSTCMAVVRPQGCGDYGRSADFLMLDQYPVPSMPMTWLSDSMDRCAQAMGPQSPRPEAEGGKGRLAAVIQAFGGEQWVDMGWPRLPTWQEMDCLAFLSVVHGARGIFFYTFSEIGKTGQGRESLGRVVGRLNQVYPWLIQDNDQVEIAVEMISKNRFDPMGRPSVQCGLKRRGDEMLLLAVNTIGTWVEALIGVERIGRGARQGPVTDIFSGDEYAVRDGKLRVRLGPYGVKAFVFAKPEADGAKR